MPRTSSLADNFLRGFQLGMARRRERERAEQEAEDRDLAKTKLKFEMDRLKIKDKEDARRAAIEEAELMEKFPGFPGRPEPTQDTPEGFVGPGYEPTEQPHPSVEVPEGGYGQAPRTIQPMTRGQKLQEQIAGRIQEARQIRVRKVDGGVATRLGVEPGEYDADILGNLARRSESDADNVAQTERTKISANAQVQAARIAAQSRENVQGMKGGASLSDEDLSNWATMVTSGEVKMPQVPKEMRTAVIGKIFGRQMAVPNADFEKKMGQFIEANAAIDKIEGTLTDMLEAEGFVRFGKAMQLSNEVNGLSRLVGRSLGEKGVFTEGDKEDFRNLMGFGAGMPGGAGVWSNFAPELAKDRVVQLRALMEKVKERTFQTYSMRTGGRLPAGAVDPSGLGKAGQPKTAKELLDMLKKQGTEIQ